MKPIEFPEQNVIFAKDQPEYQPLPAHKDELGIVTTCWELSPEERQILISNGKIYLQLMTFNQPLQPVSLHVLNPIEQPEETSTNN